jgi:NADPH:quinone reductase-like Zn-dependent oxidoreductase
MRAVQFAERGGNEVLRVVDVAKPEPGPSEMLIENVVAGEGAAEPIAVMRGPHLTTAPPPRGRLQLHRHLLP